MEITSDDIKRVVLDDDDFGHEMRVGNVLTELGKSRQRDIWNATDIESPEHGGTYTDPITSKPRQFDYRCRVIRRESPNHVSCALLAIECKNLHKSSPLVICGRGRSPAESFYCIIESAYNEKTTKTSTFTRRIPGAQLYPAGKLVGKSLLRLKEKTEGKTKSFVADTNSDVYDKWSQALASSVGMAEAAQLFPDSRFTRFFSLVLPIVVVPDNTLWAVSYDYSGRVEQDPVPLNQCEFFVERKLALGNKPFVLTHIHFVTLTGFSELLSLFWKHQSAWNWLIPAGGELMS